MKDVLKTIGLNHRCFVDRSAWEFTKEFTVVFRELAHVPEPMPESNVRDHLLLGSKVFLPIANLMHDPMERYLTEINYAAYEPVSLMKMVQDHMLQIKKYPHYEQKMVIVEPDRPHDPAPTLKYETSKQVDW